MIAVCFEVVQEATATISDRQDRNVIMDFLIVSGLFILFVANLQKILGFFS